MLFNICFHLKCFCGIKSYRGCRAEIGTDSLEVVFTVVFFYEFLQSSRFILGLVGAVYGKVNEGRK